MFLILLPTTVPPLTDLITCLEPILASRLTESISFPIKSLPQSNVVANDKKFRESLRLVLFACLLLQVIFNILIFCHSSCLCCQSHMITNSFSFTQKKEKRKEKKKAKKVHWNNQCNLQKVQTKNTRAGVASPATAPSNCSSIFQKESNDPFPASAPKKSSCVF